MEIKYLNNNHYLIELSLEGVLYIRPNVISIYNISAKQRTFEAFKNLNLSLEKISGSGVLEMILPKGVHLNITEVVPGEELFLRAGNDLLFFTEKIKISININTDFSVDGMIFYKVGGEGYVGILCRNNFIEKTITNNYQMQSPMYIQPSSLLMYQNGLKFTKTVLGSGFGGFFSENLLLVTGNGKCLLQASSTLSSKTLDGESGILNRLLNFSEEIPLAGSVISFSRKLKQLVIK